MVNLFRGVPGRGPPRPRAPVLMPRHMRPRVPPFALPRGNLLNRPIRPGPMLPPRMLPSPLPPRPRLPLPRLPIRDMRYPPVRPPLHPPLHPPPPPLHPPIHPPIHPSPLHPPRPIHPPPLHPPIHPPPIRGLGIPPRISSGPAIRGLIRPHPPIRGRGGFIKRGVTVKRLVSGQSKVIQKRKEKIEAFFCETCDRGWKTEEKLLEHVAQHQVCERDGCTFTAHPKVVMKHIQLQHDTGLYHRITANVDKWIAERKSRYPTKENVEKKAAQMSEMINRGERIPSQEKRFQNKTNNENWRAKRQRRRTNNNKSEVCKRQEKLQPRQFNKPCDNSQWRDPDAWRGDLPKFPGTAAFPLKEEDSDEYDKQEKNFSDEEEWTAKPIIESNVFLHPTVSNVSLHPTVSNVLASLMADYGSDMSDEDEDSVTDLPKLHGQAPGVHAQDKQITRDLTINNIQETSVKLENIEEEHGSVDSDGAPEECAIDHEDKSNIPIFDRKENKEQEVKHKSNLNVKNENEDKNRSKSVQLHTPMKRHQLSLLEKLLKNEIRHERNVILQCVHYVVKNNFLGSGNLPKYNVFRS